MRYVGLDAHWRQSTICVLDDRGRRILSRTIRGPWSKVLEEVAKIRKPFDICFEASTGYDYLFEKLEGPAHRMVVAHPGQLRLTFRSKRKNDRVDAEKLAKLLFLDERLVWPYGRYPQGHGSLRPTLTRSEPPWICCSRTWRIANTVPRVRPSISRRSGAGFGSSSFGAASRLRHAPQFPVDDSEDPVSMRSGISSGASHRTFPSRHSGTGLPARLWCRSASLTAFASASSTTFAS